MKKLGFVFLLVFLMSGMVLGCGAKEEASVETTTSSEVETTTSSEVETTTSSESETEESQKGISEEMAYNGVNNYCHSEYDWSASEDNPEIMYVKMGEETDSEYQVIFRSYTGAFVYFYVDKLSGTTRMVEHVPELDVEEEAGTIDLYDYLETDEE